LRPASLRPAAAFILLLALAALFTRPALAQTSQADSAGDPSYFDYDNHSPFPVTKQFTGTQDGVAQYTITYPSPVTLPYALNNTVTAYYFVPAGPGPHPAMAVLHEWLPRNLDLEKRMCQSMALAGVAALLVVQPYSLNRRPEALTPDPFDPEWKDPDAELLSSDVPHMVAALRQAVLDTRRGLDFLAAQPEIDPNRMGVSGISLGGILAGLVAGVDRRAKVLFTIVGGGDVAYSIWSSPNTAGLKQALRFNGWSYDTLRAAMAPVEPTRYLKGFDPANALLINARYDFVVRPWQAEDLAKALGGAKIVWTDTGHYGVAFSETGIKQVGAKFLRSRFFGTGPYNPPRTLGGRTIKLGFILGGHEGASPALAYQLVNFDEAGRYSVDAQLTLHGLAGALSARMSNSSALGVEFPLFHGTIRPRPYLLIHLVM